MIHNIIEWAKFLVSENGLWMLGIFSYTEALFHPIPVDPVLVFLQISASWNIYHIFFVAWISSLLGGATAYYLGQKLGKKVFIKFFGEKWFTKGKIFLEKYGMMSIIVSAITPIPFKIAAWMSGVLHMPFWKFFIAQTIGRGIRFGMVLGAVEVIKLIIPFFKTLF